MIDVIDSQPKPKAAILRSMFEARKRVFVDLLQWDVPVLEGRYEIDQFDDENAVYIVLVDPTGAHLGSARLLATSGPHILADLFAQLCDSDVPRGPDIREITRFCLDRRLRAVERRHVRNQLVTALAEYALANGISRYTCVAERSWLDQILRFGWRCKLLGHPLNQGNALSALAIEIDDDTPSLLADAGVFELPAAHMIERRALDFREVVS
ncbi:acyl-homoserine-lactone synthase [Sphingomonas sp. LaA6.9]|uniref:acyl-homoserine-lactone synthase n=1 Tax=Sphingomonas sp. LaA6.9 TaxID=2919914 RepID=UPI001F4FF2FF|nr:acyl-homoserine-lactone synthase [Sphingomonas sp. LaA6.9]MCJ8157063.1 autoinducer synthase [Sphingomonas sp. LaA6.9]